MVVMPLPKLIDKADKVFSRWIRDRDTIPDLYVQDEIGNSIPCGRCFTCGKVTPTQGVQTGDAGHFVKRHVKSLRYDEKNVHLQCKRCNKHLNGNEGWYAVNLDLKYGGGTAQELKDVEAEYKRSGYKLTRQELEEIITKYKEK